MRYMLMQFGGEGDMTERSPEWIQQMISFMIEFTNGLRESGELVADEGLVLAPNGKLVAMEGDVPTVRPGTFAEPHQSLAGWWLVDVKDEGRAIEIAEQIVAGAGEPVEVRQCQGPPPM